MDVPDDLDIGLVGDSDSSSNETSQNGTSINADTPMANNGDGDPMIS